MRGGSSNRPWLPTSDRGGEIVVVGARRFGLADGFRREGSIEAAEPPIKAKKSKSRPPGAKNKSASAFQSRPREAVGGCGGPPSVNEQGYSPWRPLVPGPLRSRSGSDLPRNGPRVCVRVRAGDGEAMESHSPFDSLDRLTRPTDRPRSINWFRASARIQSLIDDLTSVWIQPTQLLVVTTSNLPKASPRTCLDVPSSPEIKLTARN